ncbi:MAG: ribose-5-phosphate isomerase RpiA [Gemmataceae bacterium]
MTISDQALSYIAEGTIVGLGSGRAATAFIESLGRRVKAGFKIRGVPTSGKTADLAIQLGIPLVSLDAIDQVDITIDGADEVDPQLNLIKGLGGALVREKIVAASAKRLVILVGSEKIVKTLGEHGILPVEVVPFGLALCKRKLTELGCPPVLRLKDGQPFVTDNGNLVLDCQIAPLADPAGLEQRILAIPGVVGSGLFLGMADLVLVQDGANVRTLKHN